MEEYKQDYLVRALGANKQIRAFAVNTTGIVEYARKIHNNSPIATAALGRMLSAGLMMGQMLKSKEDKLTLQILCDGPIKHIIVTSNYEGTVRGYVSNPNVIIDEPNEAGHLPVGKAIGNGCLTIIRDMGMKEPYVSSIDLYSSEIAEDLTYYFAHSEQVPSSVGLGVLLNPDNTVKAAGGFIIQLMPFTKKETIDKLEENLKKFSSVTDVLRTGKTIEDMLEILFDGFDLEITDRLPVSWKCNCSFERGKEVLSTLKEEDLESMIQEGEEVEVNCDFCGSHYKYSVDDLKEVLLHKKTGLE
jgi:hsp33 protein